MRGLTQLSEKDKIQIHARVNELELNLPDLDIWSEKGKEAVAQTVILMKREQKDLVNQRDTLIRPFKVGIEQLKNEFNKFIKPVDAIIEKLRVAIGKYDMEQRKKYEAENKTLRESQQKINEENARKAIESVQKRKDNGDGNVALTQEEAALFKPVPAPTVGPSQTMAAAGGTTTSKRVLKFKITTKAGKLYDNPKASERVALREFPDCTIDYALVDFKKIRADVKAGVKVPGVEIYEDSEVMVRT